VLLRYYDERRWLLRSLADPGSAGLPRLMDGTPVRCGASRTTAHRLDLSGWAGCGPDASHHSFSWGARLMLVVTADGTVTGFGLANPKLFGERGGSWPWSTAPPTCRRRTP
jgi:hypothetical protein